MHCWARCLLILVVSVLGIGQMIAACGQKGDLYLAEPGKEARQKTKTGAETEPAPATGAVEASEEDADATASDVPPPGGL